MSYKQFYKIAFGNESFCPEVIISGNVCVRLMFSGTAIRNECQSPKWFNLKFDF